MPIDPGMVDMMLGTFRTMYSECLDKGMTGPDVDGMKAALDAMEQLGQEMDDFAAYSAKLTTEGLFNEFSKHYGSALAGNSSDSQDPDNYDDAALLKTTLDAYRDSIVTLEKAFRDAAEEAKAKGSHDIGKIVDKGNLIQPIKDVIALGESGVNYPTFLRLMIEQGLDKALEGSIAQREAIEYEIEWSHAMMLPYPEMEKKQKFLETFDALAAKSKINMPEPFEYELARQKLEHQYLPAEVKWKAIVNRWEQLLDEVDEWINSYASNARYIDPWKDAADPQRAVLRSQDCCPGQLKVREKIFYDYFQLTWDDIFSHDTYINEVNAYRMSYSQPHIDLLKRVYPHMKPFQKPPQELIDEAERTQNAQMNPDRFRAGDKLEALFDKKFGAGEYKKHFVN